LFTNQQKTNWVKILLFGKKNKEATNLTNLTNGFSKEIAQSNHIFRRI
jgi:hypothetical protein